jgi:hypothetical protein
MKPSIADKMKVAQKRVGSLKGNAKIVKPKAKVKVKPSKGGVGIQAKMKF